MESNWDWERRIISRRDSEVLGISGLEFDQLGPGAVEGGLVKPGLVGVATGADELVNPLHFIERVGLEAGGVQGGLPPGQQHAELGAPIPEVIVGNDIVPQQPQHARQGIAEDGGTDMADMHRFGGVGGTEVDNHRARLGSLFEEQVPALRGGLQRPGQGGRIKAEIQEASPGDLDRLAPAGQIELGDHCGGQVARIHLPRLGQRDQGVGLVIAEFRVRAGADQNGCGVRLRQDGLKGLV